MPVDAPAAAPSAADSPAGAPKIADLSPAACAARLAELFPALFAQTPPKPLKLRIQADIQQRSPGVFNRKSLSLFLQRYTTSTAYLKALLNSPDRIDLDGQPAGAVADEHRAAATAELDRRRALHDERRAAERAALRDSQRKEQDQARQAREAQGKAMFERASLLRAFETTTLTRANFCALKKLPEADLDAALALARQERDRYPVAEPPQRPARSDERRSNHDPRSAPRRAGPSSRPATGGRPSR